MRSKTNVILILLILVVVILLTGCKKTVEEKVAEKILEETTGADVDIKNDTTTITNDEGTVKMGTDIIWPKDKMGNLKELKANITMVSVSKEDEFILITYDDLKKDDAEKYIESLKELGYESLFENVSESGFMFSGRDDEGSEVMFDFYNEGTGSLSYSENPIAYIDGGVDSSIINANDQFEGDSIDVLTSSEEIDMTDDVPWPKDFFEDLPELEGKITGVSSSVSTEKNVYIEYVEKDLALDYIDKMKEAGFIEAPTESMSSDYIDYQASNSNGDYIIFSWNSGNYSSLTMIKSE